MTIIKPQNLSLIISNRDKLISNLPIGTYDNLVVIKSWRNKNGEQTTSQLNLINNNNFSRFTILISLITNRSFYYDKKNSNNALILAVANVVPLHHFH